MLKKSIFVLLVGIIVFLLIKLGIIIKSGLILYVGIYVYYYFTKLKKERKKVLKTIFFIYICAVIELTMFPIYMGYFSFNPKISYHLYANLEPFVDLRLALTTNQRILQSALKEIVYNGIMLIPFGIGYPLVSNKKTTFIKTVFYGFLLTLTIEVAQLVITMLFKGSRIFDVTDIITNTIGVIIGYLIYFILKKVFKNA